MTAAAILSSMPAIPAYAASSKEKVSTVYLDIDLSAKPEQGDEVDDSLLSSISAGAAEYTVTSASYTNDEDEWTYGTIPEIEVTVEMVDSNKYAFKSGLKGKVSSSVGVKKVTAKRKSDDEAEIKIQLKAVGGNIDCPEELNWTNDHVAEWEEIDGAKNYQVRLYRNDKKVATVTTSNAYYDFASYINKAGDYTFDVKAKPEKNGDSSDWSDESDEITISSADASRISSMVPDNSSSSYNNSNPTSGSGVGPASNGSPAGASNVGDGWKQNNNGWYYVYQGKVVSNSWLHDKDGRWYFINPNGYMHTGWYHDTDGRWYYLNPNVGGPQGSMMTGQIVVDGKVYNMDPTSGAWIN